MLVDMSREAHAKMVRERRAHAPMVDVVARAICKSRTCNGFECCQFPGSMGNKHKCPVDRGGFDDAAIDAIEAMTKFARMEVSSRESNREIDELEAQFGKIERP